MLNRYEYRVETCTIARAEEVMNQAAREGWRVIAVTPNIAKGFGVTVTFERALENDAAI